MSLSELHRAFDKPIYPDSCLGVYACVSRALSGPVRKKARPPAVRVATWREMEGMRL